MWIEQYTIRTIDPITHIAHGLRLSPLAFRVKIPIPIHTRSPNPRNFHQLTQTLFERFSAGKIIENRTSECVLRIGPLRNLIVDQTHIRWIRVVPFEPTIVIRNWFTVNHFLHRPNLSLRLPRANTRRNPSHDTHSHQCSHPVVSEKRADKNRRRHVIVYPMVPSLGPKDALQGPRIIVYSCILC